MFKDAVALASSLVEVFMERGNFKSKCRTSGFYNKHVMIVSDDSRVINKLETSLTYGARVIMYDHHMFIVQATVLSKFLDYFQ